MSNNKSKNEFLNNGVGKQSVFSMFNFCKIYTFLIIIGSNNIRIFTSVELVHMNSLSRVRGLV